MKIILSALSLLVILAGQVMAYPRYYQYQEPERHINYENPGALNDAAYRVGIFGTMGVSGYTMGDENHYIDQLNDLSSLDGGSSLAHINNGFTGGLGMTFGLGDFCQIGFEYEGLGAQTSGALSPASNPYGDATNATIYLPASEFGGFIKLLFPLENRWLLSFGAGLYNIWLDNDSEKYSFADGTGTSYSFFGSGLASKLWFGGEFFFTQHLSLGLDAGYRFARINDVTDENGVPYYNTDGSRFTLDYSGPFSRLGLHFYF